MKKVIALIILGFSLKSFSQPPGPPPDGPKKEKMEAMHIAFITKKLDLTPDEAQKFWPVYNEFQKKREEMHKKHREELKSAKQNIDSLSDKQVEKIVDDEMLFRQKNLDLEKEYHAKFKSVLPIKKVGKLYRAEEMFRRDLLEQISGKKDKGGPHGGKRKDMPPAPPDPNDGH